MTRLASLVLVGALALPATGARAQTATSGSAPAADSAALLNSLSACRALREDAARLACFDAASSRLVAAEQSGEIVVVDRERVRTARRQAFGLSLPSLDVLRRDRPEEPIQEVTLVLAGGRQDASGKWVLRTEEGQVWRQIDDRRLFRAPARGAKAEVRRAALGSFFMNIDGQSAIRVRREQ
jgi:hypothetical protein